MRVAHPITTAEGRAYSSLLSYATLELVATLTFKSYAKHSDDRLQQMAGIQKTDGKNKLCLVEKYTDSSAQTTQMCQEIFSDQSNV